MGELVVARDREPFAHVAELHGRSCAAHAREERAHEHAEVTLRAVLGQRGERGLDQRDLSRGEQLVLVDRLQVAGSECGVEPHLVDLRALLLLRQGRDRLGVQVGGPPELRERGVAPRGELGVLLQLVAVVVLIVRERGLGEHELPALRMRGERPADGIVGELVAAQHFGLDVLRPAVRLLVLLHGRVAPHFDQVRAHLLEDLAERRRVEVRERAEDALDRLEPVHLRDAVRGREGARQELDVELDRQLLQARDPLPELLQVALLLRTRERDPVRALVEAVEVDVLIAPILVGVQGVVLRPHAQELVDEGLRRPRVRRRELFDVREGLRLLVDLQEELREGHVQSRLERRVDARDPVVARSHVEDLRGRDRRRIVAPHPVVPVPLVVPVEEVPPRVALHLRPERRRRVELVGHDRLAQPVPGEERELDLPGVRALG